MRAGPLDEGGRGQGRSGRRGVMRRLGRATGAATPELVGAICAVALLVVGLIGVAVTAAPALGQKVETLVCAVTGSEGSEGCGAVPREERAGLRPVVRTLGSEGPEGWTFQPKSSGGSAAAADAESLRQARAWCTPLSVFGSAVPGRRGQVCVGEDAAARFCVTDPGGGGPCGAEVPISFLPRCRHALGGARRERVCVLEDGRGGDRIVRCRSGSTPALAVCGETTATDGQQPGTAGPALIATDAAWCDSLATDRGSRTDVLHWACADRFGNLYYCSREEKAGAELVRVGGSPDTRCDSRSFPSAAGLGCAPPVDGVALCDLPGTRRRVRCLIFDSGGPHVRGLPMHCRVAGRGQPLAVTTPCAAAPARRGLKFDLPPVPGCQPAQIPADAVAVLDPGDGIAFAGAHHGGGANVVLAVAAHQLHEAWLELQAIPGLPADLHPPHVMIDPGLVAHGVEVFNGPQGPVVVMAALAGATDAAVAAELALIHQLAPDLLELVESNESEPVATPATAVLTALTVLLGQPWDAVDAEDVVASAYEATLAYVVAHYPNLFGSPRELAVALIRALQRMAAGAPAGQPIVLDEDSLIAAIVAALGKHLIDPDELAEATKAVKERLNSNLDEALDVDESSDDAGPHDELRR